MHLRIRRGPVPRRTGHPRSRTSGGPRGKDPGGGASGGRGGAPRLPAVPRAGGHGAQPRTRRGRMPVVRGGGVAAARRGHRAPGGEAVQGAALGRAVGVGGGGGLHGGARGRGQEGGPGGEEAGRAPGGRFVGGWQPQGHEAGRPGVAEARGAAAGRREEVLCGHPAREARAARVRRRVRRGSRVAPGGNAGRGRRSGVLRAGGGGSASGGVPRTETVRREGSGAEGGGRQRVALGDAREYRVQRHEGGGLRHEVRRGDAPGGRGHRDAVDVRDLGAAAEHEAGRDVVVGQGVAPEVQDVQLPEVGELTDVRQGGDVVEGDQQHLQRAAQGGPPQAAEARDAVVAQHEVHEAREGVRAVEAGDGVVGGGQQRDGGDARGRAVQARQEVVVQMEGLTPTPRKARYYASDNGRTGSLTQ